MRDESLQFLTKLVNTPSPTGHEARGQRVWLDYAKKYADTTYSDAYGNCVAARSRLNGWGRWTTLPIPFYGWPRTRRATSPDSKSWWTAA